MKTNQNETIENWLSTMAFSHSNSKNTRINYLYNIQRFLAHAKKTPEQILEDYDSKDEKQFKRYYTPTIMSFIVKLRTEQYSPSTIQTAVNTVRSFFKYNNLPLNYIPTGKQIVIYHNKDITKDEIEEIIKVAEPREKAFYALMVQSGLRPNEICNLKIENLENLLNENTPIPCLIRINQDQTKGQYSEYFTFTGKESIYYLKEYLKRRKQPRPEDYLFTKEDGKTPIDTDLVSHTFRRTVTKLKNENILDFKNKRGEKANRNELRLYNLRKYFRNHTGAGQDFTNFWQGHSLGTDDHYFSKTDTEMHRKKYTETALKNLRITTKTPDQNEQTISELQNKIAERDQQIKEINQKLEIFEQVLTKMNVQLSTLSPEKRMEFLILKPEAIETLKKTHPEYFPTEEEINDYYQRTQNTNNQKNARKN